MQKQLISIVIPIYNEEAVFGAFQSEITHFLDQITEKYNAELILVDDGSADNSWQLITDFAAIDDRVVGLRLSRNFGHQSALMCGYKASRGDAILSMDADLQHPPAVFKEMIDKWEAGYDVVYGVRNGLEKESLFKRMTSVGFYKVLHALGGHWAKPNSSDFRLMSRRALEALSQMGDYHMFIRGMVGWVGFKQAEVTYDQQARAAGTTKYTISKMMRFAIDAIVSFSIAPLRLAYWLGFGLMLLTLLYVLFVIALWLAGSGELVPGWTSLVLLISAFGAMNLICLGMMGEYIGRIFEQSKGRPAFIVQTDSRVMTQETETHEPATASTGK